MPEDVEIPLSDLLIDKGNARLVKEQAGQQEAMLAIAHQQSGKLLKLAADIVENGLDPLNPPAVIPTSDQRKRYVVIEGNRRITALKALETPSLIASVFGAGDQKKLQKLAELFAQNPISTVRCVLFDNEKEMEHWVGLRHTGQNDGVGVVEWGSDEKDRFASRHGLRSPEGQILDFVEKFGALSDSAKHSTTKVISNIKRLISSPPVKEKLGIEVVAGRVVMRFPPEEVLKSLTHMVEDLKTEKINVRDIYTKEARAEYAENLPVNVLPNTSTVLDAPVPLESVTTAGPLPEKPKPRPKTKRTPGERATLIPKTFQPDIDTPRINNIYVELLSLSVEQYPNCCAVMLRVFIELSVDHYNQKNSLISDADRRNTKLAKVLKMAAEHLRRNGKIDAGLETAVEKIADSKYLLAASTTAFNQYVHNKYVFPKPSELKDAWDEVEPFMTKLWEA